RLEQHVGIGLRKPDADKVIEYMASNRTVYHPPVYRKMLQARESRVRVGGRIAPCRQPVYHTGMVPVVSDLVEKQVGFRMHLQKPVQSPFGLIKHVRNTVATTQAIGLLMVPENI